VPPTATDDDDDDETFMKTVAAPELLDLPADDDAAPTISVARVMPERVSRLRDYYELTKPRMNFLVVVTTMVGYYMSVRFGMAGHWALLFHTLLGTALTAAGASVLNQYVERDLDTLMPRTANRPLPAGRLNPLEALAFGVLLSIAGTLYLSVMVNALTAALGAFTLASYVFLYTPMKRSTSLCTLVGAIPGAVPPMMGWTAVHDNLAVPAWALFGILFFWQMPHFLAIAILFKDDYAAGGFKMLPVVDADGAATSRQIVLYAAALIPVTLFPTLCHMAGATYFLLAAVMGIAFFGLSVQCAITGSRSDARRLFFASIIYLPLLLAAMTLDKLNDAALFYGGAM
jgi:protoheme IX farnesyltransferase